MNWIRRLFHRERCRHVWRITNVWPNGQEADRTCEICDAHEYRFMRPESKWIRFNPN